MEEFNYDRFSELYGYLILDDCTYDELKEIKGKIEDLKRIIEDKMDAF